MISVNGYYPFDFGLRSPADFAGSAGRIRRIRAGPSELALFYNGRAMNVGYKETPCVGCDVAATAC
jgi:hypothetical protein